MFEQLMKGLARKGHQVDVMSTFPLKKPYPNYTDLVVIQAPRQFLNNMTYREMKMIMGGNTVQTVGQMAGNDICKNLGHPDVQQLIRNPPTNPPYDVVIFEVLFFFSF